jgi:hypothetical protein
MANVQGVSIPCLLTAASIHLCPQSSVELLQLAGNKLTTNLKATIARYCLSLYMMQLAQASPGNKSTVCACGLLSSNAERSVSCNKKVRTASKY